MSSAWEIHTFGGGEYLYDLFNGIAAMTTGSSYLNIIKISAIFGLVWALLQAAFLANFRYSFHWLVSFMLMYNVLFVPKAEVLIHDPINRDKPYQAIKNIPFALAAFASVTSDVGKELTEKMETAFSPIGYLPYHQHGMLFGSKLIEMSTSMKIVDEDFASSINSFMKQCVFYDLLLHRYSLDELKKTDDIWNFLTVTNQASQARSFVITHSGDQEIITCRKGVLKLNEQWLGQVNKSAEVFGKMIFPNKSKEQAKNLLLQHLPASFEPMFKMSRQATDLIKQNLLINAFDRAGAEFSNTGANTNIYTEIRANIQTKAAFNASRKQAAEWVPILKIVFEVLFYGAFPLIFLLFLTPQGPRVAQGYFCIFVGLQAWAPLYAILNLIMSGNANHELLSMSDYGLTIVTQAGISGINQSVAEMAGHVSWMIPFLAAGLAAGSLPLSSLATPMLAVPQSASNSAAHEAATGNISLGNVNMDNASYGNVSGNKINDSAFFDSARVQALNHAGGITTVNSDGRVVYDQSGSVSKIPNLQLSSNDTASQTASQSASVYQNMGEGASMQASFAKSRSIDMLAQHMASHSINESNGVRFNDHASSELRSAYSRIEQEAQDLSRTQAIDNTTAFNMVLSGNTSFGSGYGKSSSGGISGNIGAGMSGSADTRSSEAHLNNERVSETHQMSKDIGTVTSAIKDHTLELTDSHGNSLNESFNQNYSEAQRLEEQSRTYLDTAKNFSTQSQLMKSKTFVRSEDYISDLTEQAKNQLNIHTGQPLEERVLGTFAYDSKGTKVLIDNYIRDKDMGNFENSFTTSKESLSSKDLEGDYKEAANKYNDIAVEHDNLQAANRFVSATKENEINNQHLKADINKRIDVRKSQIQNAPMDEAGLRHEVKDKLKDGAFKTRLKSVVNNEEKKKSNFDNIE